MAVDELQFAKFIDDWVAKTEDRILRVFKASCQETVNIAQRACPIDLGFLRSSILATTDEVPYIDENKTNKERARFSPSGTDVTLIIAGLKLGDAFAFGYTAAYAAYVEYGTVHMAPRGFVAEAAGRWQETVELVTSLAKEGAIVQEDTND